MTYEHEERQIPLVIIVTGKSRVLLLEFFWLGSQVVCLFVSPEDNEGREKRKEDVSPSGKEPDPGDDFDYHI